MSKEHEDAFIQGGLESLRADMNIIDARINDYPTETGSASPMQIQPSNNPKTQQQGGSPLG